MIVLIATQRETRIDLISVRPTEPGHCQPVGFAEHDSVLMQSSYACKALYYYYYVHHVTTSA